MATLGQAYKRYAKAKTAISSDKDLVHEKEKLQRELAKIEDRNTSFKNVLKVIGAGAAVGSMASAKIKEFRTAQEGAKKIAEIKGGDAIGTEKTGGVRELGRGMQSKSFEIGGKQYSYEEALGVGKGELDVNRLIGTDVMEGAVYNKAGEPVTLSNAWEKLKNQEDIGYERNIQHSRLPKPSASKYKSKISASHGGTDTRDSHNKKSQIQWESMVSKGKDLWEKGKATSDFLTKGTIWDKQHMGRLKEGLTALQGQEPSFKDLLGLRMNERKTQGLGHYFKRFKK